MAITNGLVQKNYVSAISSLLDKREIYEKIIAIRREKDFMSFLTDMNAKVVFSPSETESGMPTYHSWQETPLTQLIDTTGATVADSGTTVVTVTGLPAGSQNKLVVGVLLKWAGGVARVQTVPSTSSFTAQSLTSSVLTLTAGTFLSAFSNAQEEGSTGPTGQRWDVTSITNQIQVFRNTTSLTDIQMRSGVEFTVDGQDSIVPFEAIKLKQLHDLQISAAMFMGTPADTLFSSASPTLTGANGRGVQTTGGLDWYTGLYGVNDSVATPGTVVLGDLGDTTTLLTAARSPRKYVVGGNHAAILAYTNFLKGLPSSGAMSSLRVDIDGKMVDLEVTKAMFGGFELNFHELGLLNNTDIMGSGASALAVTKNTYWMPLGMVNTVRNGMAPYMRYRYIRPAVMGSSAQNRTINGATMETITGGLAPVPTNNTLTADVTLTSSMGFEVFNPQAFAKVVTNA